MLSGRVYTDLRDAVLRGDFPPSAPLKPQELAHQHGVSLAVVREALTRLAGDGLADRLPNRGFVVPAQSDRRWQEIVEARRTIEPATLRLAVERGDLDWEARVRAAHHRLARTPAQAPVSLAWTEAHRVFHRTLLEGSGNAVLLDAFDRLWLAGELARRWSVTGTPGRDAAAEHLALEEAALSRDAGRAAHLLDEHLRTTADGLRATQV